MVWPAGHGIWYDLEGMAGYVVWPGRHDMVWPGRHDMVWPGRHGIVYGMAWRAWYLIWPGGHMVWSGGHGMVYGMAWRVMACFMV